MLVKVADEASAKMLLGLWFEFDDEMAKEGGLFVAAHTFLSNDDGTYDVDLTEPFVEWVNGNNPRPVTVSYTVIEEVSITDIFEMAGVPLNVLQGGICAD